MINVALFGVSGYARCLLDALQTVESTSICKLKAICIVNRDQENQTWEQLSSEGVRCFSDSASLWREMNGQIDLTILPTPPQTHFAYTLEALSAGSHVLVEKPISTNSSDALQMADAAKLAQRHLFVGFQDLYLESTERLKTLLMQGEFGEIKSISFLGLWPRELSYYRRNNWAGKLILEGEFINDNPISNAFAHFLNLCLYFAGSSIGFSAQVTDIEAELFRANAIETFDTAALRISTDSGIPLYFYCSHTIKQNHSPTIRITTDALTVDWKYEDGVYLKGAEGCLLFKLPSREEARVDMINSVISNIRGETSVSCLPEVAMTHLAVSEYLSALPVQSFPKARLKVHKLTGDFILTVDGLSEELLGCFEKGILPSEIGKPNSIFDWVKSDVTEFEKLCIEH